MLSPPATRPNSTPTNPVVTPSAVFTLEDDTAVESGMPFLDSFVGKRDKSDKTKLAGMLNQTVGILAPGKHNRSLKISSANGTDTLLTMVPKSKSESGFRQNARKSKWLTVVLEHARPSAAEGATSVARFICCNHSEQFHEVARDAGLSPMESMDTTASEAMIQDANLTNKQFQTVRRHVTYATGENFKMGYRPSELEKMEQNQTGPQPYFGVYKNVNDKGPVENCKHWLTPINDEASFAVENDVLNQAANTKFVGPLLPEEVGVVVGLDHGQGAMRGFAKFLLTSPQLRKEKNDLSYGYPIAKICHVQCKKDTYRVVRDTVTNSLVESIEYLQQNQLVVVLMQAWHGGELNGVSARLSMENSDSLFNLIEKNLFDIKHANSQHTDKDIKTMMKNYSHMYTSLGASYSFLRQIHPSDDDLRNLRENIECARKIWVENLNISATPKAHSLFDGHAYEQHERLGGIGDKLEDFVEKGHPIGMRDERRTWNIRNWEQMQRSQIRQQMQRSQIRHDRRRNHPEVCERIRLVHHSKNRKLKCLEQGGETKSAQTKRVKKEESVVKCEANLVASSSLFNQ